MDVGVVVVIDEGVGMHHLLADGVIDVFGGEVVHVRNIAVQGDAHRVVVNFVGNPSPALFGGVRVKGEVPGPAGVTDDDAGSLGDRWGKVEAIKGPALGEVDEARRSSR